jgi:hypothetical protein
MMRLLVALVAISIVFVILIINLVLRISTNHLVVELNNEVAYIQESTLRGFIEKTTRILHLLTWVYSFQAGILLSIMLALILI